MVKYLTVPTGDGDSLTNAKIHNSSSLTGLTDGKEYYVYKLSDPSDPVQIGNWWNPLAYADIDYERDRAFINGTSYASIAAARTAGAIVVDGGGADQVAVSIAASWTLAAKGIWYIPTITAVGQVIACLDNGSVGSVTDEIAYAQAVGITASAKNVFNCGVFTGGVNQLPGLADDANVRAINSGQTFRFAIRGKANGVNWALDGTTVNSDTTVTMPAVTYLRVGNRYGWDRPFLGTMKRVLLINQEVLVADTLGLLA